jgi:hypothetical protein
MIADGKKFQSDIELVLFFRSFCDHRHDRRFFSDRQDQMIDLRHPLAALVNRMPH